MGQSAQTLLERETRGTHSSIERGKKIPGGPIYVCLAPIVLDITVSKALIAAPESQDSKQEFMAQHAAQTPSARLRFIKICYSEHK